MLWITGFDDQVATNYSTFLMAFSNVSWLSKTRPKVDTLAEVCFSGHDIFPGNLPWKSKMTRKQNYFSRVILDWNCTLVPCNTSTRNLFKRLFLAVGVPSDTRIYIIKHMCHTHTHGCSSASYPMQASNKSTRAQPRLNLNDDQASWEQQIHCKRTLFKSQMEISSKPFRIVKTSQEILTLHAVFPICLVSY